jgi:hypothetical protein
MKTFTLLFTFFTAISLAFSSGSFAQDGGADYSLSLKFGEVNLTENTAAFIGSFDLAQQELVNGRHYKILQFYSTPTDDKKTELESLGIHFLEYIPRYAYVVSIPAGFDMAQLSSYEVRNISPIETEYKQDMYLLDQNYPEWALQGENQIDLMISYYRDLDVEAFNRSLQDIDHQVLQADPIANYQIVRVDIDAIATIVSLPQVYFVEPVYPEGEPENTTGKTLHRSNVLDSEYETGRHYDGTGVKVMLQDDGIIGPHIDYTGRIGAQNLGWNYGNHGDHCGGTIFGYGNLDPTVNGMAPGAELHVWGAAPDYPGFASAASAYTNTGIRISSTSYSNGCNAGYTLLARTMDLQVRNYEALMHVFSAGNAGGDNCGYGAGAGWGNVTGGHKIGKNVIATANVAENGSLSGSSSRGPAHDGRIKPDISAKGSSVVSTIDPNDYASFSGTSMACPGIAGSLAQLYQAYRELNNDEDPKGGLMKAVIMNTATDHGNIGPDFKYGWGIINNLKAVVLLEEERYMEDEISQDGSNPHEIEVPEGVKEMKVMVYWTDKEASVNASVALVNNIDITITDPSADEHLPWLLSHFPHPDSLDKPATTGIDALNNVEQVQINDPASGTYTLNVAGTDIPFGPQEYYVVYDFIFDDITLTYPIGGEAISSTDVINLRWDAYGDDSPFTMEYSLDDGATWTTVNSNISGGSRNYNWNVPNAVTSKAKVRISRDGISSESMEGFSIMGIPQDIEVDRACPESVLLRWDMVDDAVSYDVFMLGEKYMEIVGSTDADSLLIDGLSFEEEYWFSVRAIGPDNAIGRRAYAIEKEPGIWNCNFSKDLELADIISPPTGVLFGCQSFVNLPVQVEIKNRGVEPLSDLTMHFEFENEPVVTEMYNGTLEPGETMIYEFASTVSLPSNGIYDIKAWFEVSGDENVANNEVEGSCKMKSPQYMDLMAVVDFDDYSTCSFAPDCEDITCYLDNKYYNMQNTLNDDIDWRVLSGITPTQNTGPIGDHTTGTAAGNFLYLEATGDCYEKKAILTTPCVDLSSMTNPGMMFWFNMHGEDMGSLHVDVVSEGVLHKNVMDPLKGDWGSGWNEGHVYLWQFAGKEINIRFRGYTGDGELSDLAIDDLMITEITGLEDNQADRAVNIYPNPSLGVYRLTFVEPIQSAVNLKVIDVTGRTIYTNELAEVLPNDIHAIDISAFDKGVYYLLIEHGNQQIRKKLLKQ